MTKRVKLSKWAETAFQIGNFGVLGQMKEWLF